MTVTYQKELDLVGTQMMEVVAKEQRCAAAMKAAHLFGEIIQQHQYVGEVYSIGYETALVQIHDHHRQRVGGIPSLSFLIATRISSEEQFDYTTEDASILLLRVMDAAQLPNAAEAERVRVETAQRVAGEPNLHWDGSHSMDPATYNLLSFAGVKCRVIGTFFLEQDTYSNAEDALILHFGSDISNYYPNRGLKVYKPNDQALARIVNYRDPDRANHQGPRSRVTVGEIRYASTNRAFQGVSNVAIELDPADLLGQKTALFGMTRTGKSNTTKIILMSVFDLRYESNQQVRIGQLVFDPDGEYANENVQDQNQNKNPSAIKNVWMSHPNGAQKDVITYGILRHPSDPNRKLMRVNFYDDSMLQIGKQIIDAALAQDPAKYIQNFRQVVFEEPAENDYSAMTRYNRQVLVYRALLAQALFDAPENVKPKTKGLFNKDMLEAMRNSKGSSEADYTACASILSKENVSWGELATAFGYLNGFIKDRQSGYEDFEKKYIDRPGSSGDKWADEDLKKILEMFAYANGPRQIGKVRSQHTAEVSSDYADDIYSDLVSGRLVIIDQSSGEPEINQSSAERIMWHVFRKNQEVFRIGQEPPQLLIYIEEAHNLLPEGSEKDLQNVWVRTAKEGAKYNLGMVYATQEVSSIQRNILKNTANWFIGHLNNSDETRELCKYYDFKDFESSIRRAQDRGFVRVKTLSNKFVIPAQIARFEV